MPLEHDLSIYESINFTSRYSCTICGSANIEILLDLPRLPITETYTTHVGKPSLGRVDQQLHSCKRCGHVQLKNILDQELLYSSKGGYEFRSSQSYTGRETAAFFKSFLSKLGFKQQYQCILEVGCNDAYLLKELKPLANHLIGVDPILNGHEDSINDEKITVYGDFFENVALKEQPDLIICKDVIEHVTDPLKILQELVNKASKNALFLVQIPLWDKIVENFNFDQIFHQHLNYFSVDSFREMLSQINCHLVDWTVNESHWNSAIFAFTNATKKECFEKSTPSCSMVHSHFQIYQSQLTSCEQLLESYSNRTEIYGYGAALMFPVIQYHFPNQLECVKLIFDDNPQRDGQYYINSTIPIKSTKNVIDINESTVFLSAFSSRLNSRRMLQRLSHELKAKNIVYPYNLLNGVI